jgi:predicted esterase YcpF (UPF0227 family)
MRRLLYLHGWKGSPRPDKLEFLQALGFEVVAEQNYYDDPRFFSRYLNDHLQRPFEWVVGNSLGGFFAYQFANAVRIPSLMYNPLIPEVFRKHMTKYHLDLLDDAALEPYTPYGEKYIVLGQADDVIPYRTTLDFYTRHPELYRMLLLDSGLGHAVPIEVFTRTARLILA